MKPFLSTTVCNLILLSVVLASPRTSFASACCGGAFSVPTLITGDDRAQANVSLMTSRLDARVDEFGTRTRTTSEDSTRTLKLEGATLFSDRWQLGMSIPFQRRDKEGAFGGSSSGLGDVAGLIGYEFLPEWEYSPWRPKGVSFLALTAPTGTSPYETESNNGLNIRGRGLWTVGAGSVFTKVLRTWDVNLNLEAHHSFPTSTALGFVTPGNGAEFGAGVGWNTQNFRYGGGLSWNYEDAIALRGPILSSGSSQQYATGTFSLSWLFPDLWAGTLLYADQTLFGTPTNTSLSKSISLLFQKRWTR